MGMGGACSTAPSGIPNSSAASRSQRKMEVVQTLPSRRARAASMKLQAAGMIDPTARPGPPPGHGRPGPPRTESPGPALGGYARPDSGPRRRGGRRPPGSCAAGSWSAAAWPSPSPAADRGWWGDPALGQPLVVRTIEVPLAPLVRVRWPAAHTVLGPSAAASHRAPAELGIDSRVQLLPFQRRTSDPPTAYTLVGASAVTADSPAPSTAGAATLLQLWPFQCSTHGTCHSRSRLNSRPTAQTSLLASATTPSRVASMAGGVATALQADPFQRRMMGWLTW